MERRDTCRWSTLQSNIALFSGEAELNAVDESISEGLVFRSCTRKSTESSPSWALFRCHGLQGDATQNRCRTSQTFQHTQLWVHRGHAKDTQTGDPGCRSPHPWDWDRIASVRLACEPPCIEGNAGAAGCKRATSPAPIHVEHRRILCFIRACVRIIVAGFGSLEDFPNSRPKGLRVFSALQCFYVAAFSEVGGAWGGRRRRLAAMSGMCRGALPKKERHRRPSRASLQAVSGPAAVSQRRPD